MNALLLSKAIGSSRYQAILGGYDRHFNRLQKQPQHAVPQEASHLYDFQAKQFKFSQHPSGFHRISC